MDNWKWDEFGNNKNKIRAQDLILEAKRAL
jgi:hypothetical protein